MTSVASGRTGAWYRGTTVVGFGAVTCPSCSAAVPEGARFCPSCGHALAGRSDERRIVTVLFGDLVGFTTLSETRDPESVKNLVDRCFERLAADITSYGGRVDKVVGDAVVALFGAPVAHEDDAERAVRAALAMQRTLEEQAADLGAPVRMRIGVNTGEVLVGALRAGGDYTAMGDVVNTASRLQTAAQPGQVVVGPETHAATRDVFRFEELGLVVARGREEPVEAWAAIEAVTAPGRRARRAEVPLIGRDAEVGLLCSAMTTAITYRRPHLAVLVGEAGMGKSRLAEEVADHARKEHGALVFEGHSLPYGETNVWWPFAEALRQAFAIELPDTQSVVRARLSEHVSLSGITPDEVERIVEALLYLFGQESRLTDVDPSRARDEVSRAVRGTLTTIARKCPVVLVLSDVQWADPLVLELVDGLFERIHRLPLVILLTARPELETRWRPTAGRHNLVVLNLDPLDGSAAHELLVSLLGREPDPELEGTLVERSGGNPFFLEELAALLSESGGVPVLPATLRGLVAARLDALPAHERAVLDDAAVLGRRTPVVALQAMADAAGRRGLGAALDALAGRDLLVVADGKVGFGSDLVREVAYSTLTKAERARRHARFASWLETRVPDKERSDEVLEELARHWAVAAEIVGELGAIDGVDVDVRERALEALDRAADRSEDRETNLVSARLYDSQLRLTAPGEPRRRHALIGRASARSKLRQLEAAAADVEAALVEADGAGDQVARARALQIRGEIDLNAGDFDAASTTIGAALELWRHLGDRRGEAAALRRMGLTYMFAGDLDAAETALSEALAAFSDLGARKGVAWAQQNLAWIAFMRGENQEADDRLRGAIDLFADIGDWGGLGWALGLLGWVEYTRGNRDEAERLAIRTAAEARDLGDRWALGIMTVLLAAIRLWQGRANEAVEQAGEARRLFEDLGDSWGEARAIAPLARGLLMTGRRDEAEIVAAELEELAAGFPAGSDDAGLPVLLAAEMAVHLGEGERALEELLPPEGAVFASMAVSATEASVAHGLALLQAGRTAEAVAWLERALSVSKEIGPRANALCTLALACAAAGDTDRARDAADEVLALGGGTYLDRVTALLASACVAAASGAERTALANLDEADAILASTDDRLSAAVAGLARARVCEALGRTDAEALLADAKAALVEVGATGDGWDTTFRLATGQATSV